MFAYENLRELFQLLKMKSISHKQVDLRNGINDTWGFVGNHQSGICKLPHLLQSSQMRLL